MKNTVRAIALSMVLLTASIGFAGCGESKSEAPQSPTATVPVAQIPTASESATSAPSELPSDYNYYASNSSSGNYNFSLKELLDLPSNKSEIEQLKQSMTGYCDVDVFAEGDAVVYKYKFINQLSESKLPTVRDTLSSSISSGKSMLKNFFVRVREYTQVKDPKIIFRYYNADGTFITEFVYHESDVAN